MGHSDMYKIGPMGLQKNKNPKTSKLLNPDVLEPSSRIQNPIAAHKTSIVFLELKNPNPDPLREQFRNGETLNSVTQSCLDRENRPSFQNHRRHSSPRELRQAELRHGGGGGSWRTGSKRESGTGLCERRRHRSFAGIWRHAGEACGERVSLI